MFAAQTSFAQQCSVLQPCRLPSRGGQMSLQAFASCFSIGSRDELVKQTLEKELSPMSAAGTVLALEASLAPDARTHSWACEWTPDACAELAVPSPWTLRILCPRGHLTRLFPLKLLSPKHLGFQLWEDRATEARHIATVLFLVLRPLN